MRLRYRWKPPPCPCLHNVTKQPPTKEPSQISYTRNKGKPPNLPAKQKHRRNSLRREHHAQKSTSRPAPLKTPCTIAPSSITTASCNLAQRASSQAAAQDCDRKKHVSHDQGNRAAENKDRRKDKARARKETRARRTLFAASSLVGASLPPPPPPPLPPPAAGGM